MSAWSYSIILKFAPWTCLRFAFEGFATFIKVCVCVSLSMVEYQALYVVYVQTGPKLRGEGICA
jgi:hypothetical protein